MGNMVVWHLCAKYYVQLHLHRDTQDTDVLCRLMACLHIVQTMFLQWI